jgi:hypothetical protein
MAEIIQFPRASGETQEEYNRRLDLVGKLWVPLSRAIHEMHQLGADRPQVIRMLRAAMELMQDDEAAEARETED